MLLTEILWAVIGIAALAVEFAGLKGIDGTIPLTVLLRDRLFHTFPLVRLAVYLFFAWMGGHFFLHIA